MLLKSGSDFLFLLDFWIALINYVLWIKEELFIYFGFGELLSSFKAIASVIFITETMASTEG